MDLSARVPVPTLWDLAVTVIEEVEKVCNDEDCVLALSREILVHIIQTRVRNMEVMGTTVRREADFAAGRPGGEWNGSCTERPRGSAGGRLAQRSCRLRAG